MENKVKEKAIPTKRIDIVSLRMVKEGSTSYSKRVISSPYDSAEIIREFIEDFDREAFVMCCVDTKNQPTSISIVSIGSLNSALVHPREVYKIAIMSNAASILIGHNHPSGVIQPSSEDLSLTCRLVESGKLLGIPVLDHLIISNDSYLSFKEEGLL